jgi:hypothetical protein
MAGALLMSTAAIEGSACAMQPAANPDVRCSLEQSANLPPALRQEEQICGPVSRALAAAAAASGVRADAVAVRVRAVTPQMLTASVSVDGADMPEQSLRISDRALNARSIERFADGLGRQLGQFVASRR